MDLLEVSLGEYSVDILVPIGYVGVSPVLSELPGEEGVIDSSLS